MRGKRGGEQASFRGWSRQARDPAFFGNSSTLARRTDDTDDVDTLFTRVSGVQLLLPKRDEDDTTSGREQRITAVTTPAPTPKERKGGVLVASRNSSTTDKPKKEQAPVILTKDATMVDGVKLISDSMDVCEQFLDFLSSESTNYNIISAIGPQGAGKSTILSMIGGNNSQDMYRQYIFRPASREALESSRHQTTKIHAYITKAKQIFLDCQASNCASVLEETLRYSRSPLSDGRYAVNNYIEIVKLIAFLIQVSHTVLICSDWLIDIEMIKMVRTAEMFRANFEHVNDMIPHYNATRKVNLASAAIVEKLLDTQEVVDFDKSMRRLRVILAQLPKDRFSTGEHEITEKQWYMLAKNIWNDPLFDSLLEQYKGYL
ncbi:unnamed protein product [Heligmosomoides polygyrus]|uniref:Protein SMG9 n=1 Tax=Heligmosomoides polygyrus TaxID=6339 RepID=A0A3P8BNV5_HELPZ|nr:unnamed protein product [Heligmosomoides polygyrus]